MWQGLSRRVQDIAAVPPKLPARSPPPAEEAGREPDAAATEDAAADTRAGQHARRLFQTVHTLTDTGRSYSAAARELDERALLRYVPPVRECGFALLAPGFRLLLTGTLDGLKSWCCRRASSPEERPASSASLRTRWP